MVAATELTFWAHREPHDKLQELRNTLENSRTPVLPPVVGRDQRGRLVVIAGERRARVMVRSGDLVPIYVARTFEDFRCWLNLDLQQPGRKPLNIFEMSRLIEKAIELLSIRPRKVKAIITDLAEDNGIERDRVSNARSFLRRLKETADPAEKEAMQEDYAAVLRGELSTSTVLSRSTQRLRDAEWRRRALPAADQEKVLEKAIQAISGATDSLVGMGPVSPDISETHRIRWERELRTVQTTLFKIIRDMSNLGGSTS